MQPNQNLPANTTLETNDSNDPNTYRAYGHYQGNLTIAQLQAYFTLEARDQQLASRAASSSARIASR
jgi:hypothetical protein